MEVKNIYKQITKFFFTGNTQFVACSKNAAFYFIGILIWYVYYLPLLLKLNIPHTGCIIFYEYYSLAQFRFASVVHFRDYDAELKPGGRLALRLSLLKCFKCTDASQNSLYTIKRYLTYLRVNYFLDFAIVGLFYRLLSRV